MAIAVSRAERIETLEEVLEQFDRCAELLRGLNDPRIDAYCLADLEGSTGGWMGTFVRDVLEETLATAREDSTD